MGICRNFDVGRSTTAISHDAVARATKRMVYFCGHWVINDSSLEMSQSLLTIVFDNLLGSVGQAIIVNKSTKIK